MTDGQQDYARAASSYNTARQKLAKAVIEARRAGVSWTEIGRPLGISKQAAQQKFGEMVTLALDVPQQTVKATSVSHRPAATAHVYEVRPHG